MKPESLQIARGAVAEIAERFPALQMVEDEDAPVEMGVTLPVQPGLRQKVLLCLQNGDSLHFSVGNFRLDWFPCTDPKRVSEYVEAVSGYLAGQHRILEHYRGNRCVKAELQAQESGAWRTIGTWSRLWPPMPWHKTFKEVRNA
jgi:hypothetical protein